METIVNEAKGLIASLGTYARLVIVGVWFPGFLLFSEAAFLYYRLFGPADRALLPYVADTINALDSAVVKSLLGVFVLAASIAMGYVSRDIAFALSDHWLRAGWRPVRRLATIYAQLRRVYGEEQIDYVTATHPVFRLATDPQASVGLPRLPESYVREYCKQWLRLKAPSLNTEGLEIEINMVTGLVVPVALASIVLVAWIGGWLGLLLAFAALAAAAFMMYRIVWARDLETEQATLNFLFAHWEHLEETPAQPVVGEAAEAGDDAG